MLPFKNLMNTSIPEADSVVRQFLPCVLDAAGLENSAQRLRDLEPILTSEGIMFACDVLRQLQSREQDPVWSTVIEECLFWCEAAVWAVTQGEMEEFREYIDRMKCEILSNSPSVVIH